MVRILVSTLALLVSIALLAQDTVQVKVDTIAIGGPALESDYNEPSEEFRSEVIELFVPTNIADSAYQIPDFEHYGSWNTEQIFPSLSRKNPADSLVIAYEECDHAHPICGVKTSGYGYRRGRFHHGVDIDLNSGDLVRSVFAGKVRISHYSRSFGNVIVVRHHNGLESLYAHLSHRLVEPGDLIEAGDFIGLGGNTGRSSGSHLHLELRYLGKSIDPELILDIDEGELKVKTVNISDDLKVIVNKEETTAASTRLYKIKRGDNLTRIAARHNTSVQRLCTLNNVNRRTVLKVGRELLVE